MRKLCILVGGYYPYYGNPMGIVLSKLCPELTRVYDVTVITLENTSAPPLASRELVHDGVKIITTTSWLHRSLAVTKGTFSLQSLFARLYVKARLCLGWLMQGDYKATLFLRALERQLRDQGIDTLLTLSFPMQAHMAGYRFKQKHPHIRWVTYSTDTNEGSINSTRIRTRWLKTWVQGRRIKTELACYQKADYNFFSREIFTSCQRYLAPLLGHSNILDYTITTSSPKSKVGISHFDRNKINLLFAGGVGRPMRDPSYFAKLFSRLPADANCVLHLYLIPGSQPFFEADCPMPKDRVVIHDPVTPEEMRQIMDEADILVNLGNDSDIFSPSKLFDYVSTGHPLVCTTYTNRRLNEILTKLPNVLILENYSDVEVDTKRLENFCKNARGTTLPFDQIEALLPDYTTQAVAAKLTAQLG